tara:strand:+ start:3307 stop:3540 length:234 start_codon:yes stop_codon:yes gene_type:complete
MTVIAQTPAYKNESLTKLMNAYSQGIIEYRDGDQWVKYDSMAAMKIAIDNIRQELNTGYTTRPMGATKVICVSGYQR